LFEDGNMTGVFALGTVFDKPKSVKQFIEEHKLSMNEVANNIVYCLYGQQDKNAGSKLLSLCRQDAISWWHERYGDELKAFETFILPPRNGAVYKADNWQQIGLTSGASMKTVDVTPNYQDYKNTSKVIFSDGRVSHYIHKYVETEKKLIFMKLVTDKDRRKAMKHIYDGTQCECHFPLDNQLALFG